MRIIGWIATGSFYLLLYMLLLAGSDPVVRRLDYHPPGWDRRDGTMRLVLLTDTHMAMPGDTPERLARIVARINMLHPDLILLGGDYASTSSLTFRHYSPAEAVAPFARMKARHGVVAVFGNHDHWANAGAVGMALADAGAVSLVNGAIRRGPLVIGGVDDDYTDQADVRATADTMRRMGGIPVLLSHSPDVFPAVPRRIGLVLAGHAHCGQIVLPFIGAPYVPSRHGQRFRCGIYRKDDQLLIVSAGVGTSILPLRLGAPPDIWVIDISARDRPGVPGSREASSRS